jgi:hypothetical protein
MPVVWNLCLGPGEWQARYQVVVSMIFATSWCGKYSRQAFFGSYLDYLNPVQERHFLAKGLVRRVGADEAAGTDPAAPVYTGDDARQAIPADAPVDLNKDDETPATAEVDTAVENCVRELKLLQVPATAGAPRARTALRDAGHRFGNDVIGRAVKERKSRSDAAPAADDEERFPVFVAF